MFSKAKGEGVDELEGAVLKSSHVFQIETHVSEVNGLEVINVVNESKVNADMEEVVKLEGKVVFESEMEDILGTELHNETTGINLMPESDQVDETMRFLRRRVLKQVIIPTSLEGSGREGTILKLYPKLIYFQLRRRRMFVLYALIVLCDRKNCPKAYHPSCVNRDDKFFRAKGRWNCGCHQCSHKNCQKNAYYMCYTCTFSLCKGCVKDAVILCVRGNKGFCEGCIKIVMMIEDTAQGNQAQIDFDDKSGWEYLFKDYWIDLKEKLSISPIEIAQAKSPWKVSYRGTGKNKSPCQLLDIKNGGGFCTDNASDNPEASTPKKGKYKKCPKSRSKKDELTGEAVSVGSEGRSTPKSTEWASKDLLELVMHMRDRDITVLSQCDVQALLLEYIKINKLRDPRQKCQIICDARLEKIFGKACVGHFEMLKLLESHFLLKEHTQIDDVQGSVVDTETGQRDADGNAESLTKNGKDRKRKPQNKGGRGRQSNLDDYAAIDIHNISLIYLRRKLMEDLLEDIETFNDKVVGTFVRIRISASNQNQDVYRLVQVKG